MRPPCLRHLATGHLMSWRTSKNRQTTKQSTNRPLMDDRGRRTVRRLRIEHPAASSGPRSSRNRGAPRTRRGPRSELHAARLLAQLQGVDVCDPKRYGTQSPELILGDSLSEFIAEGGHATAPARSTPHYVRRVGIKYGGCLGARSRKATTRMTTRGRVNAARRFPVSPEFKREEAERQPDARSLWPKRQDRASGGSDVLQR